MDKNLRLRLVVRRNGLPEVRVLFNVSLATDPTIAHLLELVNDTVPLEDAHGEWGLDDYAVELHDDHGHAFECLHFQPVTGLLDRDDEVFIRPLLTIDLKKRRLSGRHQILSGGEHLIDGVPFGRPRLRIPRGRPAVNIAPRKRRRLTYDEDVDGDDDDDNDDEYLDGDNDFGAHGGQEKAEEPLLLTQNGERSTRSSRRGVRFTPNRSAAIGLDLANTSEDGDSDAATAAEEEEEGDDEEEDEGHDEEQDEEQDEEDDQEQDEEDDEDLSDPDSQELADEAGDLRALAQDGEFDAYEEDSGVHRQRVLGARGGSVARTRSAQLARSPLGMARQNIAAANNLNPFDKKDAGKDASTIAPVDLLDPDLQDKVTAVRFAFPQVSASLCGKLLVRHSKDVSKAWRTLEKSLKPRQGLAETMVMATQLELPREVMIVSSPPGNPAEALGEVSRIDEDEEDNSSSSDEDESDSSDDASEDEVESTGDSDSDSGSDGATEEVIARSSLTVERQPTADKSRNSEETSSESEWDPANPYYRPAKRSEAQDSSDGRRKRRRGAASSSSSATRTSSSDSEPSIISQTGGRRDRRIIESFPPLTDEAAKMLPEAVSTPTGRKSFSGVATDDSTVSSTSASDSDTSSDAESEDEPTDSIGQLARRKGIVMDQRPCANHVALYSAFQTSVQMTVPPGQGLTKTQRRNQRRRLEAQRKKAALANPAGLQGTRDETTDDTDLAAKKRALLQKLGTELNGVNENSKQTINRPRSRSPGSGNAQITQPMIAQDPDAWKQKISYRAVEVAQEGIELSEPPFPFVQRWDLQQRWNSQRKSQWRGKRKSRDHSQFYDDPSFHSAKKRRFDQPAGYDYTCQTDSTTFLGNHDDVTLDYDDFSFNPDEGFMNDGFNRQPASGLRYFETSAGAQEDGEADDLPQLPDYLSSLPKLHAEDLRAGMIIAYKQLLCTEATNWQPQLSDYVTAAVTQIYRNAGTQEFQVQLARRDRNVDRNERKFDEETGQRIYGKFEAPDADESEDADEEDLGFRDVEIAQMIDPRVLGRAEEAAGKQSTSQESDGECPSGQHHVGSAGVEAPQLTLLDFEVADSQVKQRRPDSNSRISQDQSNSIAHMNDGHRLEQDPEHLPNMDVDTAAVDVAADESFVSDTNQDHVADDGDGDYAQRLSLAEGDGVSITEERRGEISQLINDGGFRQGIRSSIDQSGFLRLGSSPSRQLEEEIEASVLLSHQADISRRSSPSEAPSEYGSKEPSQRQWPSLETADPDADTFHSTPQSLSRQQISTGGLNATRRSTSTGMVIYPTLATSQASQATQETSDQSMGRQPDPNLVTHSDDLGIDLSADSPGMTNGFDDDTETAAMDCHKLIRFDQSQRAREQTPTQAIYKDDLENTRRTRTAATLLKSTQISPPGSAGSTGSSSIFTDVEMLGSQPVKFKVQGFSPKIKNESASSKGAVVDDGTSNIECAGQGQKNIVNGKSYIDGFSAKASISPPAFSRLRRKPDPVASSWNSQDNSIDEPLAQSRPAELSVRAANDNTAKGTPKKKGSGFTVPKGSQVVSLLTSSPEPEPGKEPDYSEIYADDSVDGDYDGDSINSLRRVPV